MDHKQVLEQIPAYALGALDPDEVQEIEKHLAGCDSCQVELRAYQEVVDVLPLAAPQYAPPPALRGRLMAQISGQAFENPPSQPSAWEALAAWFRRWAPAWGLASLVLVVVLAASNLLLWGHLRQLESSEKFYVINLTGTENSPDGSGLIVISSDGKYGTLVVEELPLLDESQQYQLWLIRDGARTSGGVFSVYGSGYASLHVRTEEPLISYDSFGVTIEPAGGSPGPTGQKVLGGDSDL